MKNVILLFVVILFTACSTTKVNKNTINSGSLYKIVKIENEDSFYSIYATRNDSTFKIISYTNNTILYNCEKIKVNNEYSLDLEKIFPIDSLFGVAVIPNLGIRGIEVSDGKIIMIEEKCHNTIYELLNSNGLCLKNIF